MASSCWATCFSNPSSVCHCCCGLGCYICCVDCCVTDPDEQYGLALKIEADIPETVHHLYHKSSQYPRNAAAATNQMKRFVEDLLRSAADEGHAEAQYQLATRAIRLYTDALQQLGSARTFTRDNTILSDKDIARYYRVGLDYLGKAARQHHPQALAKEKEQKAIDIQAKITAATAKVAENKKEREGVEILSGRHVVLDKEAEAALVKESMEKEEEARKRREKARQAQAEPALAQAPPHGPAEVKTGAGGRGDLNEPLIGKSEP